MSKEQERKQFVTDLPGDPSFRHGEPTNPSHGELTNEKLVEKLIGSWTISIKDFGPAPPLDKRKKAGVAHRELKAELLRRLARLAAQPEPPHVCPGNHKTELEAQECRIRAMSPEEFQKLSDWVDSLPEPDTKTELTPRDRHNLEAMGDEQPGLVGHLQTIINGIEHHVSGHKNFPWPSVEWLKEYLKQKETTKNE